MKNHLRSFTLCILIALGLLSSVYAQQGPGPQHRREQLESQKIAYLTKELQLTPQEAQIFWPVYNQFDAKRRALKQNFSRNVKPEDMDIDKLTDKEATELADGQIIEAQKLIDLRKEYHAQFKSILPPKKVLKLYEAERGFQKELLGQIRQHRGQGPQGK
jgi:hypothetical protein